MSRPVSHQLDIYGMWIHLARTRGEWAKLKKRTGLKLQKPVSLALTQEFVREAGDIHYPVFVDVEKLGDIGVVEMCAHEAAHVAGMILNQCDAPYDGMSEPHAYLVGWATAWLWKHCKP